jgi:uncharacterized protein (TIGR02145 family)
VPSNTEWTSLTDYFGGADVAGGKLKETGTTHWTSPNIGATNITGFTALPGGKRNNQFIFIDNIGYLWSATKSHALNAWFLLITTDDIDVVKENNPKECGKSVRCVKD